MGTWGQLSLAVHGDGDSGVLMLPIRALVVGLSLVLLLFHYTEFPLTNSFLLLCEACWRNL